MKKTYSSIPISKLRELGMKFGMIPCDICGMVFKPKIVEFKKEHTLAPRHIFENTAAGVFFVSCGAKCKFDGAILIQKEEYTPRKITWR